MFALQSIAALLIWIISLLGGWFALSLYQKAKKHAASDADVQHSHFHYSLIYLAESFAGGIFLGAALFHMLPDAQEALKEVFSKNNYPLANLICAGGFCVLLLLETVTHHFEKQRQKKSLNLVPLLLTLLISIHALSEGIALGINQQTANILIIFMAIAVHKSSEGFAVSLQLQKGTLKQGKLFILFLAFSLMSPAGVMLGAFSRVMAGNHSEILMGVFNAFAAGTFLYLATLHKLHHPHEYSGLGELFFTLLGLGLMAGVAVWV